MFLSNRQDDAAQAVDNLRALITQQEYEYQRLIADLQLCVMTMAGQVAVRKITGEALKDLETGWTDLKLDLREARHTLGEAVDRAQGLLDRLTELEWQGDGG